MLSSTGTVNSLAFQIELEVEEKDLSSILPSIPRNKAVSLGGEQSLGCKTWGEYQGQGSVSHARGPWLPEETILKDLQLLRANVHTMEFSRTKQ